MSLEALFVHISRHRACALGLFFAFGKHIPALACRLWSHHHSSSPGIACPSSHTERAQKKRQHLSWSCNPAWRTLRQQTERSCWGCPASPCSGLTQEGAVPSSCPAPLPSPQCHLSTLQVVPALPWAQGQWCCATQQGRALLCCSEPAAPQKCSL